jgi:hypothetical protein
VIGAYTYLVAMPDRSVGGADLESGRSFAALQLEGAGLAGEHHLTLHN